MELDTAARELRRGEHTLPISCLGLALLEYLLRNRERVVDAAELRASVWLGTAVGPGSLRQAVWELRQTIGDDSLQPRVIRTVRGRGYRFVADVDEHADHAQQTRPSTVCPAAFDALLGRDAELVRVQSALAAALANAGRIVVLLGAPGMGKSRLGHELRMRSRDCSFVEGRGEPDGVMPALGPWRSVVRDYLDALGCERERFEAKLPAGLGALPTTATRADDLTSFRSATEQRDAMFDASVQLIVELARARPGIILLDDLQWTNDDALLLLTRLAPQLPRTNSLLLLACRPAANERRALRSTLQALSRLPYCEQIELEPLTEAHVEHMLPNSAEPASRPRLARELRALSHGNPLLTVELLRLLSESPDPLHTLSDQPELLHTVLRRRLDSLDAAAREALSAAAVWGAAFSLSELSALLHEAPQQTIAHVDTLLREGMLREVCAARYRFSHPLFREVAYGALPLRSKAKLHLLAFRWLETRTDLSVSRLGELTHHAVEAATLGVASQAVWWSTRSAEQAHHAAAYASALFHYDRALACLELVADHHPRDRLTLELCRAETMRAAGADTVELNALLLQLASRAELIGDNQLYARAILSYTGHGAARFSPAQLAASVDEQSIERVERALRALPDEPNEQRVLLLCSLLYMLITSTDRPRRERIADQALGEARASRSPRLIARVLATRIYCCAAPDQHEQRLAHCDELVELARSPQLGALLPDALATRAMCLLHVLKHERALLDAQEAQLLSEAGYSLQTRARAQLVELSTAFWKGDLEAAERFTRSSLQAAPQDLAERALFTVRMASLTMLRTGLTPAVVGVHEQLLKTYPHAVTFRCALSAAYATIGRNDEAICHFDYVAADNFRRLPEDLNYLSELTLLGNATLDLADAPRAQLIYERLLPYADRMIFYAGEACPGGTVASALADLAVTLRRYDCAERWLARAEKVHAKLGAHMFRQFALLTRARLLHAADPDDVEAPLAMLHKVKSYGEKHVRWLAMRAERTARQIESTANSGRAARPQPTSDTVIMRGH